MERNTLSILEVNLLCCLARRVTGKAYCLAYTTVECWFKPFNYNIVGETPYNLCLICDEIIYEVHEYKRDNLVSHGRKHIKESNLSVFL